MLFASGVSNSRDLDTALKSIYTQIEGAMGGYQTDLAIIFTTADYADDCQEISRRIRERYSPGVFLGCTGCGIIGGSQEYEEQPAISLLVGSLPGVEIAPFRLTQEDLQGITDIEDARRLFGVSPEDRPNFFLFPDPFSIHALNLLSILDRFYPSSVKLGGIASAGFQPESNRFYLNDETFTDGLVGMALQGDIEVAPIVSQGCRPIGSPFLVTDAEQNILRKLGNRPALEALQELFISLSEEDMNLAQTALLMGVVIDEYKTEFQRGDFLIRNLIGADPSKGSLVINDNVGIGQTIQFQVRDARSAAEDLEYLLSSRPESWNGRQPLAAFIFSCNGRGERLFSSPNHDISLIRKWTGVSPAAGFFCAGEIGPIGGKSFIHGFTSSIGFILPGS
ncbi:MAG: hypothetical protein AMXMBFR75_08530 [Candidatus Hinthialibacteria bacterium]|nr:FIST C-terminal domain-containing protein [bacterium]MBV6482650.1 hypothetical protein [bacterium]MCC6732941.1 FIST C-terminal domain-containing protein [Candidatus Omnitrophota bacterium]MCE7909278.1 hypothetical protein [Candidatus Omnitrophica bacterium COP1]